MQLHALPLQPPGADGAKAETTGQELQPDGGEQGGRLEGAAETICVAGLAALLLHAGDQHHNLMERLQPQLDIKKNIPEVEWTLEQKKSSQTVFTQISGSAVANNVMLFSRFWFNGYIC